MRLAFRLGRGIVVAVDPSAVYWLRGPGPRVLFQPSTGPVDRNAWEPPIEPFTVACFAQAHYSYEDDRRLVKLATLLRDEIGPFHLRLLGDGTVSTQFSHQLADLDITIECPGYLNSESLAQALRTSHAFLMTRGPLSSRNSSVAAALACGLPVFGFTGIETSMGLRRAASVAQLSDLKLLVTQLAALSDDPALGHARSAQSHALFDSVYDWKVVAPRLLAFLNHVR
jgi:glycosyltransferase involved in cell wall biosynthesis